MIKHAAGIVLSEGSGGPRAIYINNPNDPPISILTGEHQPLNVMIKCLVQVTQKNGQDKDSNQRITLKLNTYTLVVSPYCFTIKSRDTRFAVIYSLKNTDQCFYSHEGTGINAEIIVVRSLFYSLGVKKTDASTLSYEF